MSPFHLLNACYQLMMSFRFDSVIVLCRRTIYNPAWKLVDSCWREKGNIFSDNSLCPNELKISTVIDSFLLFSMKSLWSIKLIVISSNEFSSTPNSSKLRYITCSNPPFGFRVSSVPQIPVWLWYTFSVVLFGTRILICCIPLSLILGMIPPQSLHARIYIQRKIRHKYR